MSLTNSQDVDKLQRLQNRALRLCYNIYNPRDITVSRLHENAKIDMLQKRMMLQLMSMMYECKILGMYEKIPIRNTRQVDKYVFDIDRVRLDIYARSPYYIGSKFWNDLPRHVQQLNTKAAYKRSLRNLI